ncbi:glycoside hydrolase family 5 protein [Bacteroides sp. 51]|uniref:glycoside hydrolase family 5 protein n=1 Tax=Bacteroides sp. 51 TaxID=2302938 RepID=UPI0013D6EE5C|nr:glycoside hydrolase family 5 protein [Bacteroides sp. 51]NDV82559.1 glycoside hydrolase family 5 protein [Bacteroides sp. 51]
MKRTILISATLLVLMCIFSSELSAQSPSATFKAKKGVNISHWLSQSRARGEARLNYFTKNDAKHLAALGFDHLRIPIDEEQMFTENGGKEQEAFQLLHNALSWCQEYKLKAVVDLHILRSHFFNAAEKPLFTEVKAQEQFYNCWRLLSEELKKYPNEMLAYELMNEPVADDPEIWNVIANRCLKEVRKHEPNRTIIIGSNRWQSFETVKDLRIPANDKNLIISFHYYGPMLLTHYRAGWSGTRDYEGPVHYPGLLVKPEELAQQPANIQEKYAYATTTTCNIETISRDFKQVADVAKKYGLAVYCGEFGCITKAPEGPSAAWYKDMGTLFKQYDFGFAAWDFKGDFGVKRNGQWVGFIIEPLTGKKVK